jgi:hypothetical protein
VASEAKGMLLALEQEAEELKIGNLQPVRRGGVLEHGLTGLRADRAVEWEAGLT